MKKLLLTTIVLFSIICNVQSQVVYAYTDYAAKDDTFRISKADSLWTTNFDTTGVGITWDYSSLTPYTQTLEKVLAPNATGYVFTPVNFQNSLDRAEPISDTVYIGSVELSNTYDFFDLTSTQYKQVASASEIEGVAMKTKYDSSDVVYTFPMQYGNVKDSSNSGYTMSIGSLLYYTHTQKRVNEIEGEGTLITPYGSFSALKLKSTVYATDSFSIDSFGVPQYSYQTIEYKWFNPTFGFPLLTVKKQLVSGVTVSITARYLDSIRYFTPEAYFAYYPTTPVQGESITFQNISSNASSYYWDFDDGNTSTSVNPSHTYADTGTYMVTLIASNPTAADTFSLPLVVTDSNAIVAYFTYSPQFPCYGQDTIVFYNTSYNADTYLWDFGDGHTSTAMDTSYIYANPGTYNVKLIASKSGAADTMETQIKFAVVPTAFFTTDSVVTSPVIFTNMSTGTDVSTTYYWDFGFGATPATSDDVNPIVTYSFTGDKTVYLITSNSSGCSSTYLTSINVSELDSNVISYFSYTPEDPCFGEDSISFTNESYNANSYLWTFGDGQTSTDENPTHMYAAMGTYTVSLIAYKMGTSDTSTAQINYVPVPLAAFTVSDSLVNTNITFISTSTDTLTNTVYNWTFGVDATPFSSTQTNPTVSYSTTGVKTVSLTTSNSDGCYSTYAINLNIVSDTVTNIYSFTDYSDELNVFGNDNNLYVQYSLTEKSKVQCNIFNLLGECVYSKNISEQAQGNHLLNIPFNENGIYIIQLNSTTKQLNKKFVRN